MFISLFLSTSFISSIVAQFAVMDTEETKMRHDTNASRESTNITDSTGDA